MQPTQPFWMGQQFPNNDSWEVVQGDALAYYIQMFCDCPTVVDITGYQFQFEVKESMDPDDPNELLEVLWTSMRGECGITALIVIPKLTAALPDGRYAFDLKARSPSGIVSTLKRGDIAVLPSVNLELSLGLEVPPIPGSQPPPAQPPTGYYYGYTQGF
jgi:hypothetical protein